MTRTEWITEGAEVAELRGYAQETATLTTIARLTATQIVLANGRRYNRRTLRPVGEGAGYGSARLESADVPRVRMTTTRQAVRAAASSIDALAHSFDGGTREAALTILDEMADIIASTRKAIDR